MECPALFNSLPNGTILGQCRFKAFAENKIIVTQKFEFVLGRVENIVGKGENVGNAGKSKKHCWKKRKCWLPAFSPFPTMFSKGFFLKVVKSCDCVVKS